MEPRLSSIATDATKKLREGRALVPSLLDHSAVPTDMGLVFGKWRVGAMWRMKRKVQVGQLSQMQFSARELSCVAELDELGCEARTRSLPVVALLLLLLLLWLAGNRALIP